MEVHCYSVFSLIPTKPHEESCHYFSPAVGKTEALRLCKGPKLSLPHPKAKLLQPVELQSGPAVVRGGEEGCRGPGAVSSVLRV